MKKIKIGILGLQGSMEEHQNIVNQLGFETTIVINPSDVENIDGLIIPGGESTVIRKMINENFLYKPLQDYIIIQKKPVFGTCAGSIILSKKVLLGENITTGLFPILDIEIKRNGYGSQVHSFNKQLILNRIGSYNCIFIRAPQISNTNNCKILGKLLNNPILVEQGNVLISTFHPELENTQIHQYFINNLVKNNF